MQNYYQFMVPRLNGDRIREDFASYLSLVKKGIAGFIIFGGRLKTLRTCIARLQAEAVLPLIIGSDLERGLGQQVKGGTLFPPAMALASATGGFKGAGKRAGGSRLRHLRESFGALAAEAAYAGINTIFAPVLDINTNPDNPIISVRAFGEDEETVSFFGAEMIRQLQRHGIAACGKHFPGHGETLVDSHIGLPVVGRSMADLRARELKPFKTAVQAGVKMIMLGHLKVPAIDPSGLPVSVSAKAVEFLRRKMHYDGTLTTDALNMGGLGLLGEKEAARMALKSGVDIILHPSDPDKLVAFLKKWEEEYQPHRLFAFRKNLLPRPGESAPDFEKHRLIARLLAKKAIRLSRPFSVKSMPFLVTLSDDEGQKGRVFSSRLKEFFPGMKSRTLCRDTQRRVHLPDGTFVIVALFSQTRAWKGGTADWMREMVSSLHNRADLFVSFGSPYLLNKVEDRPGISAFWDSETAQEAAAGLIADRKKAPGSSRFRPGS